MKTRVKTVTIVSQPGVKKYTVGSKYNDLLLDHIDDHSAEYSDHYLSMYIGKTKEDLIVFEVINAPIEVEYELAKGKALRVLKEALGKEPQKMEDKK